MVWVETTSADVAAPAAVAAVFGPVQAASTFEETLERLGTGIRLGLLGPGTRLPPERELAEQLSISRSTLRQAINALTESGHLLSVRGRSGGTFVAEAPPLTSGREIPGRWRELLDFRVAVETGAVVLAAERAGAEALDRLDVSVAAMAAAVGDFPAFRRADVLFHLGLAEASGSTRLVAAMTEVQGAMSEMIGHIAHPRAVLERSNRQHAGLLGALRRGDAPRAVGLSRAHARATERVLAGLL